MVNIKELMRFESLSEFSKDQLSKLANIGSLHIFSQGKKIFTQNSFIDNLYLMVSGEVSLTYEVNNNITLILSNLRPGIFFGISSLCNVKTSQNAYCDKTSEVISFSVKSLRKIFQEDLDFGIKFNYYIIKFYHKISQSKTEDFIKYLNTKEHIADKLIDLSYLDFSL